MRYQPNDIVRHRSGSEYVVLGMCFLEATGEEAYLYREIGGEARTWARETSEMEDGRFLLVGREGSPLFAGQRRDYLPVASLIVAVIFLAVALSKGRWP